MYKDCILYNKCEFSRYCIRGKGCLYPDEVADREREYEAEVSTYEAVQAEFEEWLRNERAMEDLAKEYQYDVWCNSEP